MIHFSRKRRWEEFGRSNQRAIDEPEDHFAPRLPPLSLCAESSTMLKPIPLKQVDLAEGSRCRSPHFLTPPSHPYVASSVSTGDQHLLHYIQSLAASLLDRKQVLASSSAEFRAVVTFLFKPNKASRLSQCSTRTLPNDRCTDSRC